MRLKTILTLICATMILCGASLSAYGKSESSKVTLEVIKQKIETCRTGTKEASNEALKFLCQNRADVFPILTKMTQSGSLKDQTWANTAMQYLIIAENNKIIDENRAQSLEIKRQSSVIKNLTNYQLKDTHFYTAVILSVILFLVIIDLVRRKLLRIEYSWMWMLTGTAILVLISTGLLEMISILIGARVPQTLFFAGVSFLTMIALHYSVTISKLTNQVKNLSQELAVLRHETEEHTKSKIENAQE